MMLLKELIENLQTIQKTMDDDARVYLTSDDEDPNFRRSWRIKAIERAVPFEEEDNDQPDAVERQIVEIWFDKDHPSMMTTKRVVRVRKAPQ